MLQLTTSLNCVQHALRHFTASTGMMLDSGMFMQVLTWISILLEGVCSLLKDEIGRIFVNNWQLSLEAYLLAYFGSSYSFLFSNNGYFNLCLKKEVSEMVPFRVCFVLLVALALCCLETQSGPLNKWLSRRRDRVMNYFNDAPFPKRDMW